MRSIPHAVFEQAKKRPHAPAHLVKEGGDWVPTSWKEYAAEVEQAARALMALGVQAGDTVCILGFNRPAWVVFDVAAMAIGAAPAGIYTTCSPVEVQYIVEHAGARVVLVEGRQQWQKIEAQRERLPELETVVTMPGAEDMGDDMVLSWGEFLARAADTPKEDFDRRHDALESDDLATLIYTSGTTGHPKGVMLSHRNLTWTTECLTALTSGRSDGATLSYLPLSHIAEQTTTIHGPAATGSHVYFAESIEKVADNLREVQPTLFFGVPRIWEKFHAKVSERIESATGVKKRLLTWVRSVCSRRNRARLAGRQPNLALEAQYLLADRLVLSKLKPALGLGRAELCVSGAAPISAEILEFFASLDIVILEIYGQSEDCGPTSFNLPDAGKFGTVGRPIPGLELKIADDGEILVKGPNVFLGYYRDEEATREALEGGWLHTGDLGSVDSDGYLSITGRKKDIIITAGGKNIAPRNIETALKDTRFINEAVVIGDRRKYLTALVTLDEEAVEEAGLGPAEVAHTSAEILESIQRSVDEINEDLASVETIKKFTILPRNLTVEHGELTPTLKVKRRVVAEHFATEIEEMYR